MKIEYLGHSCFKLTESTGTSIVCDPYSEEVGFKMPPVEADAVTLSHDHFDHNAVKNVGGKPKVFKGECNADLDGVGITSIKSFHDGVRGKKRGENVIFKFRLDGIDVCHLGDLGEACSPELIELILPVNVLLIPVGGNYTIDAEMAKEYVDRIMPDVVVPMHYRTKDCRIDIDKVDEFVEMFDEEDVEEAGRALTFERSDFDTAKNTRVIVMRKD